MIEDGISDGHNKITYYIDFRTNGGGFALRFDHPEVYQMLLDTKNTKVQSLVGLPCQVNAPWGKSCSFIGMWKQ